MKKFCITYIYSALHVYSMNINPCPMEKVLFIRKDYSCNDTSAIYIYLYAYTNKTSLRNRPILSEEKKNVIIFISSLACVAYISSLACVAYISSLACMHSWAQLTKKVTSVKH